MFRKVRDKQETQDDGKILIHFYQLLNHGWWSRQHTKDNREITKHSLHKYLTYFMHMLMIYVSVCLYVRLPNNFIYLFTSQQGLIKVSSGLIRKLFNE